MKSKIKTIFQLILLLAALFSLTGGLRQEVQAATCTWEGTSGTDWFSEANWSGCFDTGGNPKHPGTDDDVIIPADKSNYPVFTVYKGAVAINTLTIAAGAQITVDEQTEIIAFQMENYGTVKIEEVTGHYLRINAPFDNHGLVNIGSEASLILYHSGTHTGSFTGKQLSFTDSEEIQREHTFQTGSSINVTTLFVDEKNTLTINGTFHCTNNMYIRTDSIVDLSGAQITSLGNPVLQGGTLITDSFNIPTDETLNGTGTLQTNLVNHGTVSPGSSPGTLTVVGNYTQGSDGTLTIELGGTTPGTEHDQLIVTGTASMSGTLKVSIINEFSPQIGDTFTILPYGTRSGGFTTMNMPEGYRWGISYGYYGLALTVLEGGSIQGTVICNSSHTVFVDLYLGDANPPPEESTHIACDESYNFSNLPDGTYYLGAWIDLNESGGGPPDDGEPYAWYGEPTAVTIIDGETKTDIDITIEGAGYSIFLPLILR